MNRKMISSGLALLLVSAMCLTTARIALAGGNGHHGPTVCEKTADIMIRACRNDTRDDYLTTIANCKNIGAAEERAECVADARDTRWEDFEFCGEVREARLDACEILGENRYDPDPLTDPSNMFVDPDDVGSMYAANPYVSVVTGHTFVLGEDEDRVIVHVTDDKREILGVECRIVVDIVVETEEDNGEVEYIPVEVTQDWFAQSDIGDVFYCGEIAKNFEDGILRDLDGSFEAGLDFAKSGFLVKAFPMVGDAHRQEYSLGEAEDMIQYLSTNAAPSEEEGGDNENFPCSPDLCLQTQDTAAIDPEGSELKYYLPGIGFVLATKIEDGEFTGEREELLCVGDSLDVLVDDAACDVGDGEALIEALCELEPGAFCE